MRHKGSCRPRAMDMPTDAMNTSTQIRARYGLTMWCLAIAIMATIAVAGSVRAGQVQQPAIDVTAIMTTIDVGSLPVHNITDAN